MVLFVYMTLELLLGSGELDMIVSEVLKSLYELNKIIIQESSMDLNKRIMNLTTTLNYRGNYPEISKFVDQGVFEKGDVVNCGQDIYVYDGYDWVPLTEADDSVAEAESLPKLTDIKCSCCGAPLPHMVSKHSSTVTCEYCGSIYSW